ncbi:MAG: YccF domain-containing protein [Oscillospiraceae bacterium]|jgi:uncharacterized membrane protein YccF (DUF307 family)|nr:YccF domain-containing protein [Oscillospiraceae bacterium]
MRLLSNILWIIFGGFAISAVWFIVGIIMCITILGIPTGIQCFKFAYFTLWPFGKEIEYSNNTGSFLLNFLWIIFFGWELCTISILVGILWCFTIVGIPFGMQCFKFAELALMPFGSEIVSSDFYDE